MNQKLLLILSAFLFTGCSLVFPSKPQESSPYVVESVETARLVILRDQKSGEIYQLSLSCLDETNSEESRQFLIKKLRKGRDILVDPMESPTKVKNQTTPTYKGTANLLVRPWGIATYWEPINAAMVGAGMATLSKDATEQNCLNFKHVKDMQLKAQKSKVGLWAKPKQ